MRCDVGATSFVIMSERQQPPPTRHFPPTNAFSLCLTLFFHLHVYVAVASRCAGMCVCSPNVRTPPRPTSGHGVGSSSESRAGHSHRRLSGDALEKTVSGEGIVSDVKRVVPFLSYVLRVTEIILDCAEFASISLPL